MAEFIDLFLEIAAHPEVASLVHERRAAFVSPQDGKKVSWTNAAGLALLGFRDFGAMADWSFSPAHPAVSRMGAIASSPLPRMRRIERLPLPSLSTERRTAICHIKSLTVKDQPFTLLIVLDGTGALASEHAASERYRELLTPLLRHSSTKVSSLEQEEPFSRERERQEELVIPAEARAHADRPSLRQGAVFGTVVASPIIPRPQPKPVLSLAGADETNLRQLSRPEKEAFEKIAEALGARFDAQGWTGKDSSSTDEEKDASPPPSEDLTLLDRLPLAIALLKEGNAVAVNRAFLDLAGYPDRKAFDAAGGFSKVFSGSLLPRDTSVPRVRRADGGETPVRAVLHSIPRAGEIVSLLILQDHADITAHERLEQAEARVKELEIILDTATDGVLLFDAAGIICGVNRSAEALFNTPRAAMTGTALTFFLMPESHETTLTYLDGLIQNGVASVLNDGREVMGRIPGRGSVPLFMTIGRISTNKFCAVLRDIAPWKQTEEALVRAKHSAEAASSHKSDFLAKISHEIRTPLTAIIGFSEIMMEERFGPIGNPRYKEYLHDIQLSGIHIVSLVNDLLDLAKIESGKLDLHFEIIAINEVVRECMALLQPQANRERIIVRASLGSGLPDVVADSRSLRQIVLNILSNAIKYNTLHGQVIVSTLQGKEGTVILRVRDTGPGMTRDDLETAMQPFRRLQTTLKHPGTGLGLPLTKALVEANRAYFHIESTPGQGTLVEITLPQAPSAG